MKDFYREFCDWSNEMGYTLAQQERRVRENLEHLGYNRTFLIRNATRDGMASYHGDKAGAREPARTPVGIEETWPAHP